MLIVLPVPVEPTLSAWYPLVRRLLRRNVLRTESFVGITSSAKSIFASCAYSALVSIQFVHVLSSGTHA